MCIIILLVTYILKHKTYQKICNYWAYFNYIGLWGLVTKNRVGESDRFFYAENENFSKFYIF